MQCDKCKRKNNIKYVYKNESSQPGVCICERCWGNFNSNSVYKFVNDLCVLDNVSSTETYRLYDTYSSWACRNGSLPMGMKSFTRIMNGIAMGIKTPQGGNVYLGIRMRD